MEASASMWHRVAWFLTGALCSGMLAVYLWPLPPAPPPPPAPVQCAAQQHVEWWFNSDVDKRAAIRHICVMDRKATTHTRRSK